MTIEPEGTRRSRKTVVDDLRDDARTSAFYDQDSHYAEETLAIEVDPVLPRFVRSLPSGAPVLDAGCGAGRDLAAFGRCGASAIGLDRSMSLAAVARTLSSQPVVVADMRALPFGDRSFSGVWASASLLHLDRRDLAPTLKKLAAVLRRGGRLYASFKRGLGSHRHVDGRLFQLYMERDLRLAVAEADFYMLDLRVEGQRSPDRITTGPDEWIAFMAEAA